MNPAAPTHSSAPRPDVAVLIGRFQPFHLGHLHLLRQALASGAAQCVAVLGSAFQARSPKNPFSWQERAEMIRAALPDAADRERLRCVPVRDCYDMARWTTLVRQAVAALAPQAQHIALIGHDKDASSGYLRHFPGWTLHALPRLPHPDATRLRDLLFAGVQAPAAATLATLAPHLPTSTLDWLAGWMASPHYPALAAEWQMLRDYRAAWAVAPYPPIFVTVDALVTRQRREVLLIRRGRAPGLGLLALPGGFLDPQESLWRATLRELAEETGLSRAEADWQAALQGVKVFDHPDRSQRGRTLTHCHWFDLPDASAPPVQAADDAAEACWLALDQLPALEDQFHDDHFHILRQFLGL